MFQELLDAIERLKNAADGDKKGPGLYLGGMLGGAIAHGLQGNYPSHGFDVVDAMDGGELDEFADAVEVAYETAYPQGGGGG
jgi:hypothetical protein